MEKFSEQIFIKKCFILFKGKYHKNLKQFQYEKVTYTENITSVAQKIKITS